MSASFIVGIRKRQAYDELGAAAFMIARGQLAVHRLHDR
jgi:hypothetical protein